MSEPWVRIRNDGHLTCRVSLDPAHPHVPGSNCTPAQAYITVDHVPVAFPLCMARYAAAQVNGALEYPAREFDHPFDHRPDCPYRA